MTKVSAVLSVYNEEKNIETALKSLKFADEIIVIDNGSQDKTSEIAKKYTDKVYSQKNDPQNIDKQKNLGIEKATNSWILIIDADEEVSPELERELTKTLGTTPSSVNGFWIPRKNYIFEMLIENAGWYPDYQLRLFRKGKGKYASDHVHEPLSLEGATEKLKEHIIHHNYQTVSQFILKSTVYAQNEADNLLKNGYEFSYFDSIRFPVNEFVGRFFARKGYKDGMHGLMLSILMAIYHFLVFAFIWESKGFKRYQGENFLEDTENEFKKSAKEVNYWFLKEKFDSIKNPITKTIAQIKNKLT